MPEVYLQLHEFENQVVFLLYPREADIKEISIYTHLRPCMSV